MSFGLVVLAIDRAAGVDAIADMAEHCTFGPHREGELDDRIVTFYEDLRSRFPDHPPYDPASPWASCPLGVGIDHVRISVTHSSAGELAVDVVLELARRHDLVVWDPQLREIE